MTSARPGRPAPILFVIVLVLVTALGTRLHAQAPAETPPKDSAAAAASETPRPPAVGYPYQFGSSSVPLLRNAMFFSAAGAVTDRGLSTLLDAGTAHLFEKPGWKGVTSRLARLYLVDMPIASLAQVLNHEYGHITRDVADTGHSVWIEGWPWPVPFAHPRLQGNPAMRDPTDDLAPVAGGSEASHVMADGLVERAYAAGGASYFDMVLYVYGKFDPSAYTLVYSGPSRAYTDPYRFAIDLAYTRSRPMSPWPEDVDNLFGTMRGAAWLNLLDYALIGSIEGTIADYVIDGRPIVRPRWLNIGPARLAPGFDYIATPAGLQYRINCRFAPRGPRANPRATGTVRATGSSDASSRAPSRIGEASPPWTANVYVRWTQSLKADSVDARVQQAQQYWAQRGRRVSLPVPSPVPLVGIGGDWRWATDRALAPHVTADIWREIDKRAAGRLELALTFRQRWLGPSSALQFGVGGKSAGFLPGFPLTRGAYVTASLLTAF